MAIALAVKNLQTKEPFAEISDSESSQKDAKGWPGASGL